MQFVSPTLLKISRPRFWMYLVGPYIIGYLLAAQTPQQFLSLKFFFFLFFFSYPLNLFLYGVNDLYDEDTDRLNPKKQAQEHLLQKSERSVLRQVILTLTAVFALGFLIFTQQFLPLALCLAFLFLSWSYSAPPFRWKAKPLVDSWSNILYIIPGLIGYALLTNALPSILTILAVAAWAAAMHLFSAIPDIAVDRKAKIMTTAVLYGKQFSLVLCAAYWSVFSFGLLWQYQAEWLWLTLLYPLIPVILLWRPSMSIEKVYWYFPAINTIMGGVAFWVIAIQKFL